MSLVIECKQEVVKRSKGILIPDNSCRFIIVISRIPCKFFFTRSRASRGVGRVLTDLARDRCAIVQNVVFLETCWLTQRDFKIGEVDLKLKLNKPTEPKHFKYSLSLPSNLLTQ